MVSFLGKGSVIGFASVILFLVMIILVVFYIFMLVSLQADKLLWITLIY